MITKLLTLPDVIPVEMSSESQWKEKQCTDNNRLVVRVGKGTVLSWAPRFRRESMAKIE